MALKDELSDAVNAIFRTSWSTRDGDKVPEAEDVALGNDAVKLNGTVLYADLADSTVLVKAHSDFFAAEIYKSFLHCAAKLIRSEGGTITAYDGDRIMAVYIGDPKNTPAVSTALKINHAVVNIIRPALNNFYNKNTYIPRHVVGIDTSQPALRQAVLNAFVIVFIGFGRIGPWPPFAIIRKNTNGQTCPPHNPYRVMLGDRASSRMFVALCFSLRSGRARPRRRHSRVNTSDFTRQPVIAANSTIGRTSSGRCLSTA